MSRLLVKTSALESLVEKLTNSNQQLVIIAEQQLRRDATIMRRRGECKPTSKRRDQHQRCEIRDADHWQQLIARCFSGGKRQDRRPKEIGGHARRHRRHDRGGTPRRQPRRDENSDRAGRHS